MLRNQRYEALLTERVIDGDLQSFSCTRCGHTTLDPRGWDGPGKPLCERCACPPPTLEEQRPHLRIPGLRAPTIDELRSLEKTRAISVQTSQLAIRRRLLWARDDPRDGALYVITDLARHNASQRRWDNHLVPSTGTKSKTYPGSWNAWPIGLLEAAFREVVAVCEGGPDFLSAHEYMIRFGRTDIAAVCMLSANVRMPEGTTEYFEGKRVRIVPRGDESGKRALERWWAQLEDAGAEVDAFELEGGDLNDHLQRGEAINPFDGLREEELCRVA